MAGRSIDRTLRNERLRTAPDEVGVRDAEAMLNNGLRGIIPPRAELDKAAKPVDRFSQKGVEGIRIGITKEQFDSLQEVFVSLKKEILTGAKTKRVWDVSFDHLGTFKISIPGVTLAEGVEAAELRVKYILGGDDRTGKYEARAALNRISGELKKKIHGPAKEADSAEQYESVLRVTENS